MAEETTKELATENDPKAGITIEISDSKVRYDSNLSLPEIVFWMEIVKEMIMRKMIDGDKA
jgi:hypothetical protein